MLLLSRAMALLWQMASHWQRIAIAAVTLLTWLPLADFHAHYFRFIERTGGEAHTTFRTGKVEPKAAALRAIRTGVNKESAPTYIIASSWWNRLPLRYLALDWPGVGVPEPGEAVPEFQRATQDGRVWFVEFSGTDASRWVEQELSKEIQVQREQIRDYAGRPVLDVYWPHSPAHPAQSLR
jgi:hypothetical protein